MRHALGPVGNASLRVFATRWTASQIHPLAAFVLHRLASLPQEEIHADVRRPVRPIHGEQGVVRLTAANSLGALLEVFITQGEVSILSVQPQRRAALLSAPRHGSAHRSPRLPAIQDSPHERHEQQRIAAACRPRRHCVSHQRAEGWRPPQPVSIRPAIGDDVTAITRIYNDSLPSPRR
jgi:hypothetical protein